MRIYNSSSEEDLRSQELLKHWFHEGLLSKPQYEYMERETATDLRRTNVFLQVVLALFTLLIVAAAAGLLVTELFLRSSQQTSGVLYLVFAVLTYAGAEGAVIVGKLYRYGIEQALAICAVVFLCLALQNLSPLSGQTNVFVPAAGAALSLWIWHRFGFVYSFAVAMVCVAFLPGHWTHSAAAQRIIIAAFYAGALAGVVAIRPAHRLDYLDKGYSLVEAFLWFGIYLAINLPASSLNIHGGLRSYAEFSRPFYWTTWVLTWCLPALVLARGARKKDRWVITAGGIAAALTLITNKPYLGWEQRSWDPMLLGILFITAALLLRRWLASGPEGIRHGFTADRLTERDKHWAVGKALVFGLMEHDAILPAPHPDTPAVQFGGGDSGGGGATSDF